MPDGYASAVSQGGTNLSGGQKQRLAIARALVRRAEIYVFDDSFSALDFATDARLRAALKADLTDATVFIVSQRIGTVMNADRIVVLDDGRVAGIGTHAELLKTLRGLSPDRGIAGLARGGRMSAERTAMRQPAAAAEHVRPRADGRLRHAGAEGQGLQGHAAAADRLPRAAPRGADCRDRRRRRRHAVQRDRSEDARHGDHEDLRGLPGARGRAAERADRLRLRRQHPLDAARAVRRQRRRSSTCSST